VEKIKVLLIEDTDAALNRFGKLCPDVEVLRARGTNFKVIYAAITEYKAQVVVTKLAISNGVLDGPEVGLALIKKIREEFPRIPIIVWTKHVDLKETATVYGADLIIEKFVGDADLAGKIQSLLSATPT
jgi:DNA-binding NarL/FixJ family response regulator